MEEKITKVVESMDELVKEQKEFNTLMARTLGSIIILLDSIRQNDHEMCEIEREVTREIENTMLKLTVDVITNYLKKRL